MLASFLCPHSNRGGRHLDLPLSVHPKFLILWQRWKPGGIYVIWIYFLFFFKYILFVFQSYILLACLFERQSQVIVIARLSSSCNNFNVALYSISIKCINPKLGIHVLTQHDKVQSQDKGNNFESYSFWGMLLFIWQMNIGTVCSSLVLVIF